MKALQPQTTYRELFIGGQWVSSSSPAEITVVNPHDETVVGTVPNGSFHDIALAVVAADTAFRDGAWRRMTLVERAAVVDRWAERFECDGEAVAAITTTEMGCPISLSRVLNHVGPSMVFRFFAEAARRVEHEERRLGPAGVSIVRREPVGVVAAIVPWNAPIHIALNKLLPALLAGCSVVLKPAPEASLGLLHLTQLAETVGLPPGILNVVSGGRETGEHLVTHPAVDRVSFTGSTAAGRRIAALCGHQLKRVGLELGGKSAAIILDDADVGATVAGLRFAAMGNSGQICALQTRILVSERRHDDVLDGMMESFASMRLGDPTEPSTEIGPLVAARQRDRVEAYIALGREEGAKTVLGGHRPNDQPLGWYVEPTIFDGVTNDMRIAREEIFGPVATVITYRDESEAVAIANDSEYGLAGSVWTTDVERGLAVARRIRAGCLGINTFRPDVNVPFGGFKASGIGREGGLEGLHEYFELQSVALPVAAGDPIPTEGGAEGVSAI